MMDWVSPPGDMKTINPPLRGPSEVLGESVSTFSGSKSALSLLIHGGNPGPGNGMCYDLRPEPTRSGTYGGLYPGGIQSGISSP